MNALIVPILNHQGAHNGIRSLSQTVEAIDENEGGFTQGDTRNLMSELGRRIALDGTRLFEPVKPNTGKPNSKR